MSRTLSQTIRQGLKSLPLQKLRASLATLKVFISSTSVIWLVAMGEGVSYRHSSRLRNAARPTLSCAP